MTDVLTMHDLHNLPTRLEDVSRHPDFKMRLATQDELHALPSSVGNGPVKHQFEKWYVVAIDAEGIPGLILFGTPPGERLTWNTSGLVAFHENRLLTHSGSIYELVGPASTEPDVFYICGWLNHLGIGKALGVPPIFL